MAPNIAEYAVAFFPVPWLVVRGCPVARPWAPVGRWARGVAQVFCHVARLVVFVGGGVASAPPLWFASPGLSLSRIWVCGGLGSAVGYPVFFTWLVLPRIRSRTQRAGVAGLRGGSVCFRSRLPARCRRAGGGQESAWFQVEKFPESGEEEEVIDK